MSGLRIQIGMLDYGMSIIISLPLQKKLWLFKDIVFIFDNYFLNKQIIHFFGKDFTFKLCELSMDVSMDAVPWRPVEGIRSPGAEVSFPVGAGK